KAAIEERPTKDLAAYELYARAKRLIETATLSTPQAESLFEAVRLLNQAIERDPVFALAYYQLTEAHDVLYLQGMDHTPARLAMADGAIQSLARLRPNSGEAHLALAKRRTVDSSSCGDGAPLACRRAPTGLDDRSDPCQRFTPSQKHRGSLA